MVIHRRRQDRRTTSCTVEREDEGRLRVVICGDLDRAGVAAVGNDVRWAALRSPDAVTIDCSGSSFVDSSGLRLLVEAQQMASARHIRFGVRPSQPLDQLLRLTGLTDMTRQA